MSSKFVLARMNLLCHYARMGQTLTITEFARMGGKALAKKMTKKERQESARKAAQARWSKTLTDLEAKQKAAKKKKARKSNGVGENR
jgi:hypothetical protein